MLVSNKAHKNRCVIISGSPDCYVPKNMEILPTDYIIACDRGMALAQSAGIMPDIFIGDFDSFCGTLPKELPVISSRPEKDDTDTMMAVRHGLSLGFQDFVLLCALGGRRDHEFANIASCVYLVNRGAKAQLLSDSCKIFVIRNSSVTLPYMENHIVSVFSFYEKASGVSIKGLKYELDNATVTSEFPIGVSNEFTDKDGFIEVQEGVLVIMILENDKGSKQI